MGCRAIGFSGSGQPGAVTGGQAGVAPSSVISTVCFRRSTSTFDSRLLASAGTAASARRWRTAAPGRRPARRRCWRRRPGSGRRPAATRPMTTPGMPPRKASTAPLAAACHHRPRTAAAESSSAVLPRSPVRTAAWEPNIQRTERLTAQGMPTMVIVSSRTTTPPRSERPDQLRDAAEALAQGTAQAGRAGRRRSRRWPR